MREKDGLFKNTPENTNTGNRKTQHFNKLAAQTDSNSLTMTATALSTQRLTVYLRAQRMKLLRESKDVRTPMAIPVGQHVQSRPTHTLLRDFSNSEDVKRRLAHTPRTRARPFIVSPTGRDATWNHLVNSVNLRP
ncbi:hypothetical protein AVEN_129879-1 [Araneus ventricosus]|uniref:Uncharacterized protein n=1 Tax=Araneus ventricosus TaxID=182803 RepID=A0A4Y2XDC6_ARAVE|nr:hypothetical protein AVEN_239463-1 [Araneus ventricosus]GBO46042.1 hypothetical protein AVEN_129879-1 [Araneus ventricosus]